MPMTPMEELKKRLTAISQSPRIFNEIDFSPFRAGLLLDALSTLEAKAETLERERDDYRFQAARNSERIGELEREKADAERERDEAKADLGCFIEAAAEVGDEQQARAIRQLEKEWSNELRKRKDAEKREAELRAELEEAKKSVDAEREEWKKICEGWRKEAAHFEEVKNAALKHYNSAKDVILLRDVEVIKLTGEIEELRGVVGEMITLFRRAKENKEFCVSDAFLSRASALLAQPKPEGMVELKPGLYTTKEHSGVDLLAETTETTERCQSCRGTGSIWAGVDDCDMDCPACGGDGALETETKKG